MLSYILIVSFVTLLYYYLFKRNTNYWTKRDVVYEGTGTPFGVLWGFITGNRSLAEICKDIYDKYPNEPYVGILWGSRPALLVRDPELVQHIYSTDFPSFHSRGFDTNPESDILADNILFMENFPKWKILRQKMSPIFTSSRLKNMFYIMEHCGRDFVKFIGDNIDVNPFNLLYTYTTASLGSAVFGIDTHAQNTMDSPFIEMTSKSIAPNFINNIRFFIGNVSSNLFKFLNIKLFGEHEDFFVGVVKNVLRERSKENVKRHDFIDLCIELQKNGTMRDPTTGYEVEPSDEVLAAQAFFYFLAGADTSANTMNFTLLELAHNPDMLNRLHVQIDETFQRTNEKPSYDDIDKLEYLDMVMNEAMRKYPTIGVLQRKCTNTTILPYGNLKVEKGVMIVLPVFGLHRDVKYYPEPEVYDPERFGPDNATNQTKYTYLPFGHGNRICLGIRFARLQLKIGIASLLRHYTLQAVGATPKTFERSFFSIRSTEKAHYRIVRRN